MNTNNKTLAVDVLAVLRSQLSWIGPCRPDFDEIDCERWDRIEAAIAALAEMIESCDHLKRDATNERWAAFHAALARVKGESA